MALVVTSRRSESDAGKVTQFQEIEDKQLLEHRKLYWRDRQTIKINVGSTCQVVFNPTGIEILLSR
jgi:hypothetical protein